MNCPMCQRGQPCAENKKIPARAAEPSREVITRETSCKYCGKPVNNTKVDYCYDCFDHPLSPMNTQGDSFIEVVKKGYAYQGIELKTEKQLELESQLSDLRDEIKSALFTIENRDATIVELRAQLAARDEMLGEKILLRARDYLEKKRTATFPYDAEEVAYFYYGSEFITEHLDDIWAAQAHRQNLEHGEVG